MTIGAVHRLIKEVKARMPEITRPFMRVGGISVWSRPPLFSGLSLGDVSLDNIYPLKSNMGSYELADAYEEFIHGYILGDDLAHRRPYAWIRRNLGLQKATAKYLTPIKLIIGGVRARDVDWLAIVLWAIHKAVADSKLTLGDQTMVVSFEDKEIGVKDGVLLSDYSKPKLLAYVPDFKAILTQPCLGERGSCRLAGLNKYYLVAGQQPEGEAMQLALRIAYWRLGEPARLEDKLYGRSNRASGEAFMESITAGLLSAENQVLYLFEKLVPKYTNRENFMEYFGSPYYTRKKPLSAEKLEEWFLSIQSLIIQKDGE